MFCIFLLTAFFSFIFGLYLRPAFISVQGRSVYLISITNSWLFKYLLQKMTRLLKIIQNLEIVTNLTLFTHTLFFTSWFTIGYARNEFHLLKHIRHYLEILTVRIAHYYM
jgi:hypothetical protein